MDSHFKKSCRHTIMDGRVITFARDFTTEDGFILDSYKSVGNIEVSASRNKVMVHRADLHTIRDKTILKQIIDAAWHEHRKLASCNGRPDDDWKGEPKEVNLNFQTN